MNAKIQTLPIMLTIQLHMPVENIIQAVISELQSLTFRLFKWLVKQPRESQPRKVSYFAK